MSNELEELKKQKREIEKRIKQLTAPVYTVDGAEMCAMTRRGEPTGKWEVRLKEIYDLDDHIDRVMQNKLMVFADSREKAVQGIYNLIYSLQNLADIVDEDGKIARKMRGEQ